VLFRSFWGVVGGMVALLVLKPREARPT